jgi:hypothetical protein
MNYAFSLVESGYVPDILTRIGIRKLLSNRVRECQAAKPLKGKYIQELQKQEIALNTKEANEQHYEVPTEFFKLCLGPHLKYSSALFEGGSGDLGEAEIAMLELYAKRAEISDGHSILELGCGWGSLTLFLAGKFPKSQITVILMLSREFQIQKRNVNTLWEKLPNWATQILKSSLPT